MRVAAASLAAIGFLLHLGACGSSNETKLPPKTAKPLAEGKAKQTSPALTESTTPALPWAEASYSPRPGSTPEPDLEKAEEACGRGDAALHEAAGVLSQIHAKDGEAPNLDTAKFHLRRLGSPYVMPRLWSAQVQGITPEQIADNIRKWASAREPLGEFRCGLGLAENDDGSRVVTALQVDVLAEVKPVPTQVDSGTWIDFDAQLLSPTTAATVLLLPPEGRPRQLNTKLSKGRAQARFSVETEGTWLVQLMATQAGGPRPVAQMLITADQTPPSSIDSKPVPGEKAFDDQLPPKRALFALMNAAREDQGLPPLKWNRRLSQVAEAHSGAMRDKGRISHNTGDGNPAYRVENAGLHPKATGENVALAGNVIRLHRVLWASPAHRENLLLRRWDEAGVAIVPDDQGTLYATQLFIDSN